MQAAGRFNRPITIQSRAAGLDSYGQPNGTWSTFASEWAWFVAPAGKSVAAEEALSAEVSSTAYSIRISRFATDITAGMRVLDGTTVHDIRQVIPDYAGRAYTDLVCVTGASQG